jgi:hypothetical protein
MDTLRHFGAFGGQSGGADRAHFLFHSAVEGDGGEPQKSEKENGRGMRRAERSGARTEAQYHAIGAYPSVLRWHARGACEVGSAKVSISPPIETSCSDGCNA